MPPDAPAPPPPPATPHPLPARSESKPGRKSKVFFASVTVTPAAKAAFLSDPANAGAVPTALAAREQAEAVAAAAAAKAAEKAARAADKAAKAAERAAKAEAKARAAEAAASARPRRPRRACERGVSAVLPWARRHAQLCTALPSPSLPLLGACP